MYKLMWYVLSAYTVAEGFQWHKAGLGMVPAAAIIGLGVLFALVPHRKENG